MKPYTEKFDKMTHYQHYNNIIIEIFAMIVNLKKIIHTNSLVIMQLSYINAPFTIDMITILQYIFKDVHIIRTIMTLPIYHAKSIICEGLNIAHLDNILPKLEIIYKNILDGEEYSNILKDNVDTPSIKIILSINKQMGEERIKHINQILKLMDIVYNGHNINIDKLKIIQNSEKLKAINLFNKLDIKPNFNLLFSQNDINLFSEHDKPVLISINHKDKKEIDVNYNELLGLLSIIEEELYLHKSYLNRVEWGHFKKLDEIFRVTKPLKKIIKEKKLIYKSWHLSQAFFKMLEILWDTELESTNDHMSVFHICEAPGQFIKSFEIYSKKKNIRYKWKAQTLLSTEENTALTDVYGFMSDPNMRDNWLYGEDKTGDITSYVNILEYERSSKHYKYNIVTSDCGIGFVSYEFQEEEIEFINYSQFITMLLCLQKGGSCAMKVFLPLVRPIALYMAHLLFENFETVIYYKPSLNLTSSEIYLIGKGYKNINNNTRDTILSLHKSYAEGTIKDDLIKLNLDKNNTYLSNIKAHYDACNKLVFNSISCINKYLFYYYYGNFYIENKIKKSLENVAYSWIKKHL